MRGPEARYRSATQRTAYRVVSEHAAPTPPASTSCSVCVSATWRARIVAHTAATKKAEIYNNFVKVKHAVIFEAVKLGEPEENSAVTNAPIQKLMSAPLFDEAGNVTGVLQISRKAHDLPSAGPDFTPEHLQMVERAAKVAAQAPFIKKGMAASI